MGLFPYITSQSGTPQSVNMMISVINDWVTTVNALKIARVISGTATNAVAAVGTLTVSSGTPADGKKVTIDGKVYTFKTTLTPTEGEVLINGSLANALTNLGRAIGHTGTPDTDYKCAAAHTTVTVGTVTGTTVPVTYKTKGVAGNSIAVSTDVGNGSWDGAGGIVLGGTTAGVDGTVTDGYDVYQDGSYVYIPTGANTITGTNWKKASLA